MNTELTDRLRADMENFTRDVRVPPGIALRAYRHTRKRRKALRLTVASGAATAVAASAVAIAWVSGAFSPAPAPASKSILTTAYVVSHVERALAPASIDNLIDFSRLSFPPGTRFGPSLGGLGSSGTAGGAGPQWNVTFVLHWQYQALQKYSAYSPSGQHVFDVGASVANGSATVTAVIYRDHTWWTATVPPGQPASQACAPNGSIQLRNGPGNGWPAFIRAQLACGSYAVTGRQEVDGIDAIKITAGQPPAQLTIFVDPATYLPVQLSLGPLRMSFQWLDATPANLALLKVAVPAGFQQVAPPAQP
jgi:hypothetical protein